MAVNKVVYGTTVLVDLTSDTVTADTLAKGVTAHDKSGAQITGTMTASEDLDAIITELETKVATLNETLEGKASGGGGSVETCTVSVTNTDIIVWIVCQRLVDGAVSSDRIEVYDTTVTIENVICGSLLTIWSVGVHEPDMTNMTFVNGSFTDMDGMYVSVCLVNSN